MYGIDDTMKTIIAGGVETIVCWEGLTHNRVALTNKETGEKHIKYIREEDMNNPKHYLDLKTGTTIPINHFNRSPIGNRSRGN